MSLGYVLLVLALYVLTAARLTRLVNYDAIFDPIRLVPARRASTAHTAAVEAAENARPTEAAAATSRERRWNTVSDFLACPWCVGMWISAALAPAAILVIGWPLWTWAIIPFPASHLIGICDRWVSEDFDIVDQG